MIEIIDNLSQVLVAMLGCIISGVFYYKSRKQPFFILTCFYGCFMLAGLYWMLYTILVTDAPPMFYVSEIGWLSSYLFLYLLQYSISDKEERAFRCSRMYVASAVIIFFTLYYISIGSLIYNIIIGGIMLTLTWCSVRGFVYQKKQLGSNKWQFHLAVIVFVALENCLWLSSYPWVSDTWTNPYFWIDFMLTTSIFLILPSVRKAVEV